MIKDFDELNTYPEYPESETIEEFADFVLDNSTIETRKETIKKLIILADKQYHTYVQPSISLKEKIRNWIIKNWIDSEITFLESTLIIVYCFSLDKTIFEKALNLIKDERQKKQWMKSLENSDGNNINPWWDLEMKK